MPRNDKNNVKRCCKWIADYMGALVLASALLALAFPDYFGHLKPSWINPLLGVIMFGMGLTLKPEDFRVVFSRPKDVIIGCLAQFTVMPLLAFALARLFAPDEALTIGVILVGCCPGGTASNVITYLAKGDLALSVGRAAWVNQRNHISFTKALQPSSGNFVWLTRLNI